MATNNIYFGIEFPQNSALTEADQKKLAKKLFVSPTTSAKEAKQIIHNNNLLWALSDLMTVLDCEIEKITKSTTSNDIDTPEYDIDEIINEKLDDWKEVFGLPTQEEMEEVLKELRVNKKNPIVKSLSTVQLKNLLYPNEIGRYLSQFVIGQDEAVKAMSIVTSEHKLRISSNIELPKSSALLIGSTGSGKSYLINKCNKILDVPIVRINCGELVPSGIVGNTINNFLTLLYKNSDNSIEKASTAVIHFDEIDKLTKHYHQDDSFKTNIQNEIIKLLDLNEKLTFNESHKQFSDLLEMNSSNLMLIFSGAFSGIEDIILERLMLESDGNLKLIDKENLIQYTSHDDIIKYGILPELAGRISFITPMRKLNSGDMHDILAKSKNSVIERHIKKCELLKIKLQFTNNALRQISEMSASKNIGARGIDSLLNDILKELYYECEKYENQVYLVNSDKIKHFFLPKLYVPVYASFDKNVPIDSIAVKFGLSIDTVLDLYKNWLKLKK